MHRLTDNPIKVFAVLFHFSTQVLFSELQLKAYVNIQTLFFNLPAKYLRFYLFKIVLNAIVGMYVVLKISCLVIYTSEIFFRIVNYFTGLTKTKRSVFPNAYIGFYLYLYLPTQ